MEKLKVEKRTSPFALNTKMCANAYMEANETVLEKKMSYDNENWNSFYEIDSNERSLAHTHTSTHINTWSSRFLFFFLPLASLPFICFSISTQTFYKFLLLQIGRQVM